MNQINFTAEKTSQIKQNNFELRKLMSLPPIKSSEINAVALPPELPPQNAVTGDQEVDAALWLEAVVGSGNTTHIKMALEAIKAIKTPLKELGKRYSAYMVATNPGNFLAGIRFVDFGDLTALANRAITECQRKNKALSAFGSVNALFAESPAEKFCIKVLRGIKEDGSYFLPQDNCNKRFLKHTDMMPSTLDDCLFEIAYWDEMYSLRNSFGTGDHSAQVNARTDFLYHMLALIHPRDKAEALDVLEYILERDSDRNGNAAILRNLVGGSAWN